jgi:hypothetical protein
VAVGQDLLERARREGRPGADGVTIRHGLAEATGLESDVVDVVTMCLVMHELPTQATCAIMTEAFRCAIVPRQRLFL